MPRRLRSVIGHSVLKLGGWDVASYDRQPPKSVMVCYPHTSNWDFVYMKAAAWHYGLDISWLGKTQLFHGLLGWLLRRLGGIPAERNGSLVDRMVAEFASRERLILCIPPEGTRGRVDHWRLGFCRIARAARVPLQLAMLDYGRRHIEVSAPICLSGDIGADMDRIRAFYAGSTGRYAELTGEIRLNEESE